MKLSKSHLDFYMMKKYPLPGFGEKWQERRPDINELINYSAGVKQNVNHFLRRLYRNPGTSINPRKRSAYALRLLRRLNKTKGEQ